MENKSTAGFLLTPGRFVSIKEFGSPSDQDQLELIVICFLLQDKPIGASYPGPRLDARPSRFAIIDLEAGYFMLVPCQSIDENLGLQFAQSHILADPTFHV